MPDKKSENLSLKQIILKGSFIAILLVIPSLSAFFLSWVFLDNLFQAVIIGGIIHFVAMGFSLKISKKFLTKKRFHNYT